MDQTDGVQQHQKLDPKGPSLPAHLTDLFTLSPDTGEAIEDRLAAVLESIRAWDWRARTDPYAPVTPVTPMAPAPPKPPLAPAAPALRTTAPDPAPTLAPVRRFPPVEARLRAVPTGPPPSPFRLSDAHPSGGSLAGRPGWNTGAGTSEAPTAFEPPPRPPAAPLPPMRLLPPEPDDDREAKTLTLPATPPRADNVDGHTQGAPPVAAEGAPPVPAASLTERWPKNFGKIVLVLVTVLLVVVIVAIIRKSADTGSSSNSLSPTKVTQKKPAPTTTTTPATSIPVSSSVLSAFTTASLNLDAANATVTRELAGGASQSVGQVAQEVAPYVTALNTFNFQTHSLAWPTSLQVPSSDVTLRTNELISYLSSVSTATPATLPAWFAQFHALARVTEQEDNVLRAYLGLAPTTSYPTK